MSQVIYLSHLLTRETQGYGGALGLEVEAKTSICCGDSSNSSLWKLSNHIGTHIDAPYHFADHGQKLDTYPAASWIFDHPFLMNLPAEPNELISAGEWAKLIPLETDLLLLKTGFEKHRNQRTYWAENPGLSSSLGDWLRKERPALRAVGMDVLSTTAYAHRPEGRKAHTAFLDPALNGNPILLIEDMNLEALTISPRRVIVAPLRIRDADGAPVTVFAEV